MIRIISQRFWLLLLLLPVTSQAALFRADYNINFYPPNSCVSTSLGDLTNTTLNGTLQFYFQSVDGGNVVPPGAEPAQISSLACGSSLAGAFAFNMN